MTAKKEKIKGYLKKRGVLAIFLVLFLIFGFYSIKLMSARPYSITRETVGGYTQEGKLIHSATLRDNSLYGSTLQSDYYPIPLVKELILKYAYTFTPSKSITGTYDVIGTVKYSVNRGDKNVVLWEDKLFEDKGNLKDGKFTIEYHMNISEINKRESEISKQLGIRRLRRSISITVNVKTKGKVYNKAVLENFEHTISLMEDSNAGLYYFNNPEKVVKRTITTSTQKKNAVNFFGIQVDIETARVVAPILALIFLIPLVGGVYTIKSTMPTDELRRIRPYIVEGMPGKVEKRILLSTPEDLEKTFELIDKPILHYIDNGEEFYVIIDGNIAYEYRRLLEEDLEEEIKTELEEEP
ncbi:DUF5305 family protein [Thermococcus sp.]